MIKEILRIMENNARVTAKQISTMTGIPNGEVAKVIKEAEKDRTILKYKTVINWDKVENSDEHVFAFDIARNKGQACPAHPMRCHLP